MQAGRLRDRVRACRDELAQVVGAARDLQRGAGEDEQRFSGRYTGTSGYERTGPSGFAGWRAGDGAGAQRIERAADRCMFLLAEMERDLEDEESGTSGPSPMAESRPYASSRDAGRSFRGGRYYRNSTFGPAGDGEPYAPAPGTWRGSDQVGTSWADAGRYRSAYEAPPSPWAGSTSLGAGRQAGEPLAAAWQGPRY